MSSTKPVFIRNSHDEQRIIHREKVSKLVTPGSGVFTILAALALNPGIPASFPWLSNEAAGWESYRFNRVRTIWVPTSGTQVAGDVIMAPDYDAADAAPSGETAMSSYTDAEEANVWARFACNMESDLLNGESRRKYVRLGALPPNLDIKTYDSGNLFVASTDDAVANTGKLWIEYDVTLYNPHTPPGGFQASAMIQGSVGNTAATVLGTAPVATGSLVLSAALDVLTIGNVQVGQELLLSAAISGGTITVFTAAATTGLNLKSNPSATTMVNGAANAASIWSTFIVTAPNPTLTFTVAATSVSGAEVVVSVMAPVPAV